LKKGDLIGYVNMDGTQEWGIVTSNEPFMYKVTAGEPPYLAVVVSWPNDPNGVSETRECVSTVLSDDVELSGIWLQSSL
tara:strand:+ start:118 stop:354 length:237 start_codon:yes stop_codon:yes gene_type:complete